MNRRWISLSCILGGFLMAALLLLWLPGTLRAAGPTSPQPRAVEQFAPPPTYTYSSVITVTSSGDPDDSSSSTCYTGSFSDESPCTLRRAIVEAGKASSGDRPVLIKFNIPTTDTGYITRTESISGYWQIELNYDLPTVSGGGVIIDGDTQGEIGGREDGPKIVIKLRLGDTLQFGSTSGHSDNVVRALALQQGEISLYGGSNVVEYNWVGLTDDGEGIYYVYDDPTRSNYASISGGSSSHNNLIRRNVVASSNGESIVLQGDSNVVIGNYVGTRADGTIDDVPLNRRCRPDAVYHNWFTGDGIRVSGDGNRIGGPTAEERNVIAGMLFASQDPANSPPYGIEVLGADNTIQNNYIGRDANGDEVWVCGDGIYVDNSFNEIVGNTIVNAGNSGVAIYGSVFNLEDGITLRGNVIKDAAYAAIEFGPTPPFPMVWRSFNPAQVTGFDGLTVSGTAGDSSPCDGCVVELFLDDGDDQVDALQSLGVVTAEVDGSWVFTLTETLPPTRGLRTTSTTVDPDQISGFAAGTTSRLSALYSESGVTPPPTPEPTPTPVPPPIPMPTPPATPEPPVSYATVLTVTSTGDPNADKSYTCYEDYVGPPEPAPDGKCTLRRAIYEASADEIARPVLIKFNIETSDPGYSSTLNAWKIVMTDTASYPLPSVKGGQVTIDGETQREISGRLDGPPIIVELYPNDNLSLGETQFEGDNIVRGLAIQQGYVYLAGDRNIVEDNWVGLTDDGEEIYYIDRDPRQFNYATINVGGGDNNVVRDNVVASSKGESIVVGGDQNVVVGNYVGTRADGTIDDVPFNRKCHSDAVYNNWFTGDGIRVSGSRNWIGGPTATERNVIAGMLFASADPNTTPPYGIEVYGHHNVIQNNYIGKDANGKEVGVCGVGIYVNNRFNRFLGNDIVATGSFAFGIYGDEISLDAITLQGNTFKDVPTAIQFGPTVPVSWTLFSAAKITDVVGTTVYGTSGDDSLCPYCQVELFLDDGDDYVETLQSVAAVTAEVDGTWAYTLTETLPPTRGLRTASTTSDYGQIPYFEAGTTTDFSDLYPAGVIPPPTPEPPPVPTPMPRPMPTPPATPEPPVSYATVLTVTSTGDPNADKSYTCYEDYVGPPEPAPDGKCTLRRAIYEASADEIARPVLIKFNIETSDPGYSSTLNAWKIVMTDTASYPLPSVKGGQVTIDGETQREISGRLDGPPIIVELYPNDNLSLGETQFEGDNIVRGLAIQQGYVYLAGDRNIVEDNWVGLTDDGEEIYYIDRDPRQFNYATINVGGGDNNVVRDNVVASSKGESIVVGGDQNVVVGNYVGTRADGTIDDVPFNRKCHSDAVYNNWFTGDGIRVSGSRNWIGGPTATERNVIAGMLFASADPNTTPPYGIEVYGHHNVVQNNYIGKDANGKEVGVCGVGVYVNNGFNQFLDNDIVATGSFAFGIYGNEISLDAITLQGNTFKDVPTAIEFGPTVPITWTLFSAAKITDVVGTTVYGTSGDDSLCPYCQVELFLDDGDDSVEALEPIVVVTATADGTWTAPLVETLAPTQGLRTASTTSNFGVIQDFEVGTTTDFSGLYPDTVDPPAPTPEPMPVPPPVIPVPEPLPTPEPPVDYVTIITVTHTDDPDTSSSNTCYRDLGTWDPPGDGICSLRRAIIEANHLDVISRPVLIKFNIPMSDPGYINTAEIPGAWKMELAGNLRPIKGGQVTIDGETQGEIGGRGTGPKIIIELYAGDKLSLGEIAGEQGEHDNIVRGLALQEGYISLVGDRNIVENNWVGLSDDGQTIHYRYDNPAVSNYATIQGGSHNNLITGNVVATSIGVGINLEGDDNVVIGNYVGTRADGTLPDDIPADDICVPDAAYNWWTGVGIDITGDRNRVGGPIEAERNVVVGMLSPSASSTPPTAVNVDGDHNLIQRNYIGKDANGKDVWVCGAAMDLDGQFNRILDNTIVNAGLYAFGIWGDEITLDALTVRRNALKNVPTGIMYGPLVPEELINFNPALATVISGTEVTGISDDDCPYCFVDVYLDDGGISTKTLTYLGSTTATVSGNWGITMTTPLTEGYGLRTVSTVRDYGVIEHFEAGTSSKFSILFKERPPTAPDSVTIITPTGQLWTGEDYSFTALVSPAPTTTLPVTYTWEATDLPSQTLRGGLEKSATFNWSADGAKTVQVTARNAYGEATASVVVEVVERVPLAGVEIDGPITGTVGTPYVFTAVINPTDATQPTFDWAPEPNSGQGTSSATYQWALTGTYVITVTAENYADAFVETHEILIGERSGTDVYLPLVLRNK
jgi:hypothetical protein